MTEKIIGYLLIASGILIIIFSSLSVYDVFSGRKQAISPFDLQGIDFDVADLLENPDQKQVLKQSGAQTKTEIVPSELVNDPLNLFAHLFLMGFFVTAGAKISDIGTKLVRPIKVNLREAKSSQKPNA